MSFSFSFSGDDIDVDPSTEQQQQAKKEEQASASAFPVAGKPQLPPTHHSLPSLLSHLPSKIAYSLLPITLTDSSTLSLPRRELWDVRVQLMAEDSGDGEGEEGLGTHDVKTGVYEGGFKSWESSVDLVKVLGDEGCLKEGLESGRALRIIELGCGTALPSLALLHWLISTPNPSTSTHRASFVVADYNPSVLQLVTLPNFILTWALLHSPTSPASSTLTSPASNASRQALKDAFSEEGELELTEGVVTAFQGFLQDTGIALDFFSGGWSSDFVNLIYTLPSPSPSPSAAASSQSPLTLLLGAETIYSPFALTSFTSTLFTILTREKEAEADAAAYVAAKRLYFGVGGSLDDFVSLVQERGTAVRTLREESEGVRRGVVRVALGDGDGL